MEIVTRKMCVWHLVNKLSLLLCGICMYDITTCNKQCDNSFKTCCKQLEGSLLHRGALNHMFSLVILNTKRIISQSRERFFNEAGSSRDFLDLIWLINQNSILAEDHFIKISCKSRRELYKH